MTILVKLMAIGGMAMHLPFVGMLVFLLVIALPLLVCFIIAVVGVLLTLAATIWAQIQGPIAVPP